MKKEARQQKLKRGGKAVIRAFEEKRRSMCVWKEGSVCATRERHGRRNEINRKRLGSGADKRTGRAKGGRKKRGG
jgi:hypothetical protein